MLVLEILSAALRNCCDQVAIGIDVKEEEDVLGSVSEIDIAPDHADENVGADHRQARP